MESTIDYVTSTNGSTPPVKNDLVNLSPNAWNATLYYEGDGLSVLGNVGAAKVALFTGAFDVDEERRAQVDAVLTKPFTLGELSQTVADLAAAA